MWSVFSLSSRSEEYLDYWHITWFVTNRCQYDILYTSTNKIRQTLSLKIVKVLTVIEDYINYNDHLYLKTEGIIAYCFRIFLKKMGHLPHMKWKGLVHFFQWFVTVLIKKIWFSLISSVCILMIWAVSIWNLIAYEVIPYWIMWSGLVQWKILMAHVERT